MNMFIDLVVVFLLFAFSVFGVKDGFLVSALKFAAWFFGILAVLLFSSKMAATLNANIDDLPPLLALGIGAILAFFCAFLPIRVIALIANTFLKNFAVLTFANHLLGGAFGFLKGLVASILILSIIYLLPAKGNLKELVDSSVSCSIYEKVPFAKLWKDFKAKELKVEIKEPNIKVPNIER